MANPNRNALITEMHKVLKKHYTPVTPPSDRKILEHMLYACCLENSLFEAADETFAKLQQNFFDWNEVRVTTITELGEVMSALHDPTAAAQRLKKFLQGSFEAQYTFDLDGLKKQNIGQAIDSLEKWGATPYGIAYITQHGLGGHAIPVNDGVFQALVVLGIISESEAAKRHVPGMERTIPKTKGIEFASLLHQLGTEYAASPFSPRVRGILLEIDPECKDRFPKRASKKDDEEETAPPPAEKSAKSKGPTKEIVAKEMTKEKEAAKESPAKSKEKPHAKATAKPVEKAPAKATEKHAEKPVEKHAEKSAEKPTAKKKAPKDPAKETAEDVEEAKQKKAAAKVTPKKPR